MVPQGSISHSHQLTTCPNPEPDQSIPFLKIHFNINLPYMHGLPSGLFPSDLPTKTMYAILLFPYVPHNLPISFFLIWSPK